jgi:hypothetical protein
MSLNPLPLWALVGEGGSPQSGETGEGYLSASENLAVQFAEATPHPALRATFSHMGIREGCPAVVLTKQKTPARAGVFMNKRKDRKEKK